MIAMAVHSFFCWRIWALGKNVILPAIIVAISLAQCVSPFYTGVQSSLIADFSKLKNLTSYIIIWLGGSALCDTMIAVSMTTFLVRASQSTRFQDTNTALNKLITLTIETGMITAFATMLEMILLLVYQHNNMHFIVCIALAKLYTNTLLATLNSRAILKSTMPSSQQWMTGKKSALWDDEAATFRPQTSRQGVRVSSATLVRHDDVLDLQNKTDDWAQWSTKAQPTTSL